MRRTRREAILYQERLVLASSRRVGTAFEDLLVKPQSSQPVAHCVNVAGFAVVRRAGEGQLSIRQSKLIGRTTFD